MLTAFLSLTTANLKMYLRNPVASFSIFAALLAVLIVFKVVLSGQAPHTRVAVVDLGRGPAAAALVRDLRAVPTFDVSLVSEPAARAMLGRADADMEVVVPGELGRRDATGRPVPVQLQVTYRAGTAGETSLPLLKGVVEGYDEVVLNEVPPVSLAAAAVHTRSPSPIDLVLPGVVAFNIIGSALMQAAGTFANYKTTGVLRRLKATGIAPSVFVAAHGASTFLLGLAQTAAILVAAALLFSVHLDLPSLFVLVALAYLVFLAMGLAIGGWIRDGQRATAIAQGIAFPMVFIALLSGALPAGVTAVTRYLPVSYVTDAMTQLGQGAQLSALGGDLAWLAGWAAALLVAASRVFRWD